MKTITIYTLNNDDLSSKKEFVNSCIGKNAKHKNSLILFTIRKNQDYDSVDVIFKSKYKSYVEQIKIEFKKLCLEINKYENNIKKIIEHSFKIAKNINNEHFHEKLDEKTLDTIFSKIKNKFYKYSLYESQQIEENIKLSSILHCNHTKSIIDLVNEIFCDLLSSHILRDGNKRFCTVLLIETLYKLGYYLKYTKNPKWINWMLYKKLTKKILLEYNKNRDVKKMYEESKKEIFKNGLNIVIALNFTKELYFLCE